MSSQPATESSPAGRPLRLAFIGDPNSIHVRRWSGWFADRGHTVSLLVPAGFAVQPGLQAAISVEPFTPYYRSRNPLLGVLREKRSLGRALERRLHAERHLGKAVCHAAGRAPRRSGALSGRLLP